MKPTVNKDLKTSDFVGMALAEGLLTLDNQHPEKTQQAIEFITTHLPECSQALMDHLKQLAMQPSHSF